MNPWDYALNILSRLWMGLAGLLWCRWQGHGVSWDTMTKAEERVSWRYCPFCGKVDERDVARVLAPLDATSPDSP